MTPLPRLRVAAVLACLLAILIASPAFSAEPEPAPAPSSPGISSDATVGQEAPKVSDSAEKETTKLLDYWKRYTKHMDSVMENVIALDLWGISTVQLPKGVMKIKFRAEHQEATERWDYDGGTIPIAPSIEFPNVFHELLPPLFPSESDIFFVDLQGANGGGKGWGYTFQVSYGITDPFDWYIEIPFQHAQVNFDVTYTPGDLTDREWRMINGLLSGINARSAGPPIDLRTVEGFWQFVEALGRPPLVENYESQGWDLGDIHTGFSYNYHKSKYFAVASTARVYLPTGYQPPPNNSIELFTGAGFPAGVGAWGLGWTQGFDARLPKPLDWVIFTMECTYEYRFSTRRGSPIFPKRAPLWEDVYQLLAEEEPEIAILFPDLSDMGEFWQITYGSSFDGEIGITFNPLQILPFGVKYAGGWSQEPVVESPSESFVEYVKAVEIVGEQAKQVVAFGAALSLLPFYVPLNITFEYRIPVWGYGGFVVEDNWALTGELFLAF